MTRKRKSSPRKKCPRRKRSIALPETKSVSERGYHDSRGKMRGWGPYSVSCVADYDPSKDEACVLLGEVKILNDRIENLRREGSKLTRVPALGFRAYRIGKRAIAVQTLSQMTYSTSADTAR